jgi:hypothetical protein
MYPPTLRQLRYQQSFPVRYLPHTLAPSQHLSVTSYDPSFPHKQLNLFSFPIISHSTFHYCFVSCLFCKGSTFATIKFVHHQYCITFVSFRRVWKTICPSFTYTLIFYFLFLRTTKRLLPVKYSNSFQNLTRCRLKKYSLTARLRVCTNSF